MDKILELGKKYGVALVSFAAVGLIAAIAASTMRKNTYVEIVNGTIDTLSDEEE